MFGRPDGQSSESGHSLKRAREDSPPLFSDDETDDGQEDNEPAAALSQEIDAEDAFMDGLMDGYEDLSPDEIEAKDAEYAQIYAYAMDLIALAQVAEPLRQEAERRRAMRMGKPSSSLPSGLHPTDPDYKGFPEPYEKRHDAVMDPVEDERRKQELADEEFARMLQKEIDASAPSSSTSHEMSDLAKIVERDERRKRKLQEDEDAQFAKKMQMQLEKEYQEELVAKGRAHIANRHTLPSDPPAGKNASNFIDLEDEATLADLSRSSSSHIKSSPIDLESYQHTMHRASSSTSTKNFEQYSQLQPIMETKVWNPIAGCYELQGVKPPQQFIPPRPIIRSAKDANPFLERSSAYNPPILPTRASTIASPYKDPIYDMNQLVSQTGSSQSNNMYPDEKFDPFVDGFERPLKEEEVTEQLKDLLENVAITAAVPPVDQRLPSPPDLKVTLLEHQKIGVEWMLRMENGTNKGGILADDMGLGKTVQSITCCILNPSKDRARKTTLIVAPTSLILQWKEELKRKVDSRTFKVGVYYAKDRKGKTAASLKHYDIVLTTYGTVAMEWPQTKKKRTTARPKDPFKPNMDADNEDYEQDLKDEEEEKSKIIAQRGELFKVGWHRVILDEAHLIKNKNTRSARACTQLTATHRWCLTGTPIQNNIGELYSLINFLNIKPYSAWEKFRDDIEQPFKQGKHKRVMKRVQALLKAICLRRTKNSTLDGKPIISLPEKTVELVEVAFTSAEREFYKSLEEKTLLKFNAYLKAGTVMQNYSNVLVLLLRLRQACCHPSLVAQNFSEAPQELLDAAEPSKAALDAARNPLEDLNPEIQQRLLGMKLKTAYECPICFDAIIDGKILPGCGHVFCGDCISGHVAAVGVNGVGEEKVCPQCRGQIDVDRLISVDAFLSAAKKSGMASASFENDGDDHEVIILDDDENLSEKAKGKRPRNSGKYGSKFIKDEDDEEIGNVVQWISSSKIDNLMKVLMKSRRESPHDKTIIFSQFRGMMDLCERPLRENKIGFVRYDGSMNADQRDHAVQTLQHDPETTVILVSLKCGSLGLNLTCANRVIIADFWWNIAVENQAVDRVHRFGQMKPVVVHRISIKDTVEQRILQLQKEKQDLFNAALGEGGVKGLSRNRLGLNDLIHLFNAGNGQDLSDDEN
ncbi:hypothetical protein CcCBS67573_g01768 [Chytriomyces confervae]|uniref:RING-type domain-containing protein n=1 Tax=Chytriomyces confervae TaxID=246404 RepID=A0A507FMM7_9FUNG|nr:hypothetical protein CcCBS67573_g01768 [Chytriomyces confervae]